MHCVLELDWVQRAVSVFVHDPKHPSEAPNAVAPSLLARSNHSGLDFPEVADLYFLFQVGVAVRQIVSRGPHELSVLFLSGVVHVAFEALHRPGLVQRLGEPTRAGERIHASGPTHVEVLPLQVLSPHSYRLGLGVVSLGQSLLQLVVSCSLQAAVNAVLHDELQVSVLHFHEPSVLGLHYFSAHGVLVQVLGNVSASSGRVKVPSLLGFMLQPLFFSHLFFHHGLDLRFSDFGFPADLLQVVSGIVTLSIQKVFCLHQFLGSEAIDSVGSVVEHFVAQDWFLEVQVSLGNVLLHNGSIKSKFEFTQ